MRARQSRKKLDWNNAHAPMPSPTSTKPPPTTNPNLRPHRPIKQENGAAAKRPGGRLISICSSALILAAAGVLDRKAATTDWSRNAIVRERFPKVRWDLNRIHIFSDTIFTSAGVSTGIDLALAIIRRDCGAKVALEVAQELVVYLQRPGGQSQFYGLLSGQFGLDSSLSRLVEEILRLLSKTGGSIPWLTSCQLTAAPLVAASR